MPNAEEVGFPPKTLGVWRALDGAGRQLWLKLACRRHFDLAERGMNRRGEPGSVFTIDGCSFDDYPGFFCAVGEAVNGPGGYFGSGLESFDDCLFGGFGLESPCTLVWKNVSVSRRVLGPNVLRKHCEEWIANVDADQDPESFAEGRASAVASLERAQRGERTMFDELVELIRSVPERHLSRRDWRIILVLEE
ncbi:MAG: barstar family protein [Deltaproteobacteria bacterium]|nr:barstar family protein [Deltaproteobacteria bacterium]